MHNERYDPNQPDKPWPMLLAHFRTQAAMAAHFGVSPQSVGRWPITGIPPDRALDVESATYGKIKARDVLIDTEHRRAALMAKQQ